MKAIEQYFPLTLFSVPYKVVLTFVFVDEILKWVPFKRVRSEQYFLEVLTGVVRGECPRVP